MGFCFRGGIHMYLGALPGRHVIYDLLGVVHTFHLLPLHRCIHCVIFLWDCICQQIFWYHWNLDHYVFIPVYLVFQVEILYLRAHVSWFDVRYGAVYTDFYGGQVWCWCADLSWVIYQIPSYSDSCSVRICFWGSDISYRYHICCPSVLWFFFVENRFDSISSRMLFPTLG